MAGFMDGLDAESYDRHYTDRELYRRILPYFGSKTRLVRLSILVLLQGLSGTAVPLMTAKALDIVQADRSITAMAAVVGLVTFFSMASWFLNNGQQRVAALTVGDMVRALRIHAFDAVFARDMRFFDQHLPGRLISRITSDTQETGTLVTLFADMFSSLFIVILIALAMILKNTRLALLTLATLPLIWAATSIFRRVARRFSIAGRRVLGLLNGQIQEIISGIAVAKGFRQEAALHQEFRHNNERAYAVNLRLAMAFATIFPVFHMILGLGTALIVYVGGTEVLSPRVTAVSAGDWYFFLMGMNMIFFPLTSLASFYSQMQAGLSAAERVFGLLDGDSELRQASPGITPERVDGHIEFDSVSFYYKEGSPVFRSLSLVIPPGQSLALVGHTGAGKSSIVNLLSRNYEFQSGTIRIDGVDIRRLNLFAWRKRLGIILQEQLLFDMSVLDNIRYACPEASEADVEGVLERLGVLALFRGLPEGLKTPVRERGARLSIGQRQLIAFARTFLQDPAVLVLDEATASVDPMTEARLHGALETLMKGRTTVIIAHRLTTIRRVDRIIALDHGRIVEDGTHEELMAKGGYYSSLFNTYYRHQSLDYIESMGSLLRGDAFAPRGDG